ncbi:MAG: nucleoside recognition domain-containing protein, partial [Bacteroidales bacterium]
MAEKTIGTQFKENNKERILRCIKEVIPSTSKTCIWLIKITISVSLAIMFLKYFNILPWFSSLISPIFNHLGLPGEAALPYVTGYFVNVYAAISVAASFDFNIRALTILCVMILCSHNMITETAVQKKTGSSAIRMAIIRTLSAFVTAFVLNKILPGAALNMLSGLGVEAPSFIELVKEWAISTGLVVLKMTTLIFTLAIMQKLLSEYGVI